MNKFKIPSYAFDFINGLLRINGDIALSNKTPANDVTNRIINTFLIKPRTPEAGIFIFDINGWVDEHVIEMISLKEPFSKIDYVTIYYFENNSVGNGISESSLVKKIQRQCGSPGKTKGLSEIAFQFSWGSIIVQHDIKLSSSCIILQYKKKYPEDQLIMSRKNDTTKPLVNIDKSIDVQKRIIEFIKNSNCFFPKESEIGWLILLKKLPEKLKICLLHEISLGNSLITLNCSDWPDKGSVVALLSNNFRTTEFDKELHFRKLNDPHYYREEISYIEDNVAHLIIN